MRISTRGALVGLVGGILALAVVAALGLVAGLGGLAPAVASGLWAGFALAAADVVLMTLVVRRAVRKQKRKDRRDQTRRDLLREVAQYERAQNPWMENN